MEKRKGRPKKDDDERRSKGIRVRLTLQEKADLELLSEVRGEEMSNIIRELLRKEIKDNESLIRKKRIFG